MLGVLCNTIIAICIVVTCDYKCLLVQRFATMWYRSPLPSYWFKLASVCLYISPLSLPSSCLYEYVLIRTLFCFTFYHFFGFKVTLGYNNMLQWN